MLRAVQSAREAARRATCQNNLKQIGLAVQMYHQTYEQFPMGSNYQRGALWSAYLLPFVKQKPMFDSLTWSEGGAGQWAAKSPGVRDTSISPVHRNILACETVIDTYRCPSVPGTYLASASGLLTDQNGITSNPVSKPHFRELDGVMFNDSRVRRRHVKTSTTCPAAIISDSPWPTKERASTLFSSMIFEVSTVPCSVAHTVRCPALSGAANRLPSGLKAMRRVPAF